MRDWTLILGMVMSMSVYGQNINYQLEIFVIKETLPQFLNNNPNSAASYLRDGGSYKLLFELLNLNPWRDTPDFQQGLLVLNNLADSLSNVLTKQKIVVLLSDTLFAYNYSPKINYKDGYSDTTDLKVPETWEHTKNFLIEVFQTELKNPVDLEFIDLIYDQIHLKSSDKKIILNDLNKSYYEYSRDLDSNSTGNLRVNGIRLYKPVFNKNMDKACYLFSSQAGWGPYRKFVFVEKQGGLWVYIESYGSHHIDSDDNWFK